MVVSGRKGEIAAETERLLADHDAMDLINNHFIPALDEVGVLFDQGKFFLPQLMASAEAARVGFDTIKRLMPAGEIADKGKICVATVKGDIHDIGKNIVKMLLDNYGYTVFDLGRDVDPQEVLKTVKKRDIKLVGLSALMTTTVVAMEETIKLLHAEVPDVKIIVGGAVLHPRIRQADRRGLLRQGRRRKRPYRRRGLWAVTQRKQPRTKTCRTRHLARAAR